MSRIGSRFIIWIMIAGGVTLGVLLTRAPGMPEALSLKQFSVDHQIEHIRQIARKPHAIGTLEHARVREYILEVMRGLEYEPQVQQGQVVSRPQEGYARLVRVENLLTRIPGRDSRGAILLMAHYDSVPDAPGANDDSAAVAAILEILRIFSVSDPPANDIIALITDAEEIGMLGAQYFFEQHPWARDVSVVLNLEARGCTGASYMYETGPQNARLIKIFSRHGGAPIANSLTHAIYQRMPNDSDFTVAKSAGLAGLNFAYIDGWQVYHTPLDNIDNLNPDTLYHQGSNVLQLVQALSETPLETLTTEGDAVYFSLWRPWLIYYPASWVWPLTGLALALFLGTLILGLITRRFSLWGLVLGFLGFLVTAAGAWGLAYLLEQSLRTRWAEAYSVIARYPDFRHIFLLAFLGLAFFVYFLIHGILQKRQNSPSLAAGGLLWWALGTLAVTMYMPQGSFLLVWPLILAVISLWIVMPAPDPESSSPTRALFLGLLMLPGLILLTMLFVAFNTAFQLYPPSIMLPVLLLGILGPSLALYTSKASWITGVVFLLLAGGAVAWGFWGVNLSERPLHQHLIYERTEDSAFLSFQEMTPWALSMLPDGGEDHTYGAPVPIQGTLKRRAYPAVTVPPPRIEFVPGRKGDTPRKVRISVRSARRAPLLGIQLAAEDPFILQLEETSEKLFSVMRAERASDEGKPHRLVLHYWAIPEEGIELILETEGLGPIQVGCADISFDLPQELNLTPPERGLLLFPRTLTRSQAETAGLPGR